MGKYDADLIDNESQTTLFDSCALKRYIKQIGAGWISEDRLISSDDEKYFPK